MQLPEQKFVERSITETISCSKGPSFQGRSDFQGKQMDGVSLLKQRVSGCQLACEIRDLKTPFSIAKITM